MATISCMLRPEGVRLVRGSGSGVPGCVPSASSPEGDGSLTDACVLLRGSPPLFMDSSAELSGDSDAGLQLPDVFGVPSEGENKQCLRVMFTLYIVEKCIGTIYCDIIMTTPLCVIPAFASGDFNVASLKLVKFLVKLNHRPTNPEEE